LQAHRARQVGGGEGAVVATKGDDGGFFFHSRQMSNVQGQM
jgi:hypothetical protein